MRRTVIAVLAVSCVALWAAAQHAADQKAGEKYPDISIKDLKAAMADKSVTIIDANGSESYRDGHIPGAINFEADAGKLQKVLPRDKNSLVVAYCGGPQCMAYKAAAEKAVALGYTNVKHLSAGISGWKSAGETVQAGGKASS